MALGKCPECGGDFSSYAKLCPHCGFNPVEKRKGIALLIAILIVLPSFLWFKNHSSHEPPAVPSDPPRLSAGVTLSGNSFKIKNHNSKPWTDVYIEVNGGLVTDGFKKHLEQIPPGEATIIPCSDFADSYGTRLNLATMKPQKMFIQATFDERKRYWSGQLP
ncbi:MAG: hypothetical protein KJ050_10570 [Candidatus Omnitrophica bacterium]|nr:hypothetical protein [Candidatus Omnitrophota bacterium]